MRIGNSLTYRQPFGYSSFSIIANSSINEAGLLGSLILRLQSNIGARFDFD